MPTSIFQTPLGRRIVGFGKLVIRLSNTLEYHVLVQLRVGSAGTGGDEAALFAGDLYDMYTHYARDQGWKVEDIAFSPGEQGGFKEVVFSVTGEDVYPALRYESGGHRVQRVPKTETAGPHPHLGRDRRRPARTGRGPGRESRTRTSSGSGCGPAGRAASTSTRPRAPSASGTRRTPGEIEVKCQDERSQHKNYDRAMRILRSRVFERQQGNCVAERPSSAT